MWWQTDLQRFFLDYLNFSCTPQRSLSAHVSYPRSSRPPFTLRHGQVRCSGYHTHTPFIDMTSIAVWGRLASAQTVNCALLTLMKYPQNRIGGFSQWLEGGLGPVSIWSTLHKLMEERKASQDEWIELAPSPTSLVPLYLPLSPERWKQEFSAVC